MTHRLRPAHLLAAFGLLAAALLLARRTDSPSWLSLVGLVAPDLVFLGALWTRPEAPGLMPRALVPLYNTTHHPATPPLLLAASVLAGPWLAVVSVSWAAHIAWDRGVGYDLRRPDGSIRTHDKTPPTRSAPASERARKRPTPATHL